MPRFVALFRGINVGKAKRIAMADLRALLESLGYTQVKTLLNSGNAVFTGAGAAPAIAKRVRAAVAQRLGVDAAVIVKSAADVAGMIDGNALAKVATDDSRLLVAAVQDNAALALAEEIAARRWGEERIHVGRHAAYLWCANGILESQAMGPLFAAFQDNCTTRNWGTLKKIHVLLAEPADTPAPPPSRKKARVRRTGGS